MHTCSTSIRCHLLLTTPVEWGVWVRVCVWGGGGGGIKDTEIKVPIAVKRCHS